MNINKPNTTHFSTFEPGQAKALAQASYKIGQVLNATVLTNSHQGRVAIRIGNMQLSASTNIALQQNTPLELKVAQLQPRLQLQILHPGGGNPLPEAMLKMLPQQTSLAPLLAELAFQAQAKQPATVPAPLQAALKKLIAALPTRQNIRQADGLQRAVAQSGLFLEAKLAAAAGGQHPQLATDLKSLLLRYLGTLRQSRFEPAATRPATRPSAQAPTLASGPVSAEVPPPLRGRLPQPQPQASPVAPAATGAIETHHPALLKQLEGALARIGLHQVATAENFNEGQNLWQLEIPVRQGNAVEIVALTIERETARNSADTEDEDAWSVNLSLDLPNLGSLQSRISMDKQGLSTTFWTRSRNNLSLIEKRLPELRRNLELHGLEINQCKCIDGQQPTAPAAKADGSLIDYLI
ncbi:MAG: hypothetical protein HKN34_09590 [Gammaproteobacteria bacterium]|nr:hypothetical protein [Gammaproteobacteria bacterium]